MEISKIMDQIIEEPDNKYPCEYDVYVKGKRKYHYVDFPKMLAAKNALHLTQLPEGEPYDLRRCPQSMAFFSFGVEHFHQAYLDYAKRREKVSIDDEQAFVVALFDTRMYYKKHIEVDNPMNPKDAKLEIEPVIFASKELPDLTFTVYYSYSFCREFPDGCIDVDEAGGVIEIKNGEIISK